MPTETFFNLPKEKQKRILLAAKKEFSRAGLNEASIANVIKDATIPRGSFYQYFENKEDLFYYYLHTIGENSHRKLIQSIKKANGNVFEGFETLFSEIIPKIFVGDHALFYKNVFMNMDYHGFRRVVPNTEKQVNCQEQKKERMKEHQELFEAIDFSLLKIKSEHEMHLLMQMLLHASFTSIADGYRRETTTQYDIEQTLENFRCKLDWLKNGVGKDLDK